jgi:ATP-dependent 26S proteasome regulatory subunit
LTISLGFHDVLGYASAQLVAPKFKDFIEKQELNHEDNVNLILEKITPEEVEATIAEFTEKVKVLFAQDILMADNFLMTVVVNHMTDLLEVTLHVICKYERFSEIKKMLLGKFEKNIASLEGIVRADVNWYYSGKNGLDNYNLSEAISENIHNEAYPVLGNVDEFIDAYFASKSPILILIGPAGTGKSRLIRYIVQRHGNTYEDEPEVIYTSDMTVIEDQEAFFINFRVGDSDFMILEDIDAFLQPRKDSNNEVMHKFLAASDGFLRTDDKKIIMTTNLSQSEIDPALIRPGRCFSHLELDPLNATQAGKLAHKIDDSKTAEEWQAEIFIDNEKYTLADIYDKLEVKNSTYIGGNRVAGFVPPSRLSEPAAKLSSR